MQHKIRNGLVIVAICIVGLWLAYRVLSAIMPVPSLGYGATWHNITIGKSTKSEVVAELGPPTRQNPFIDILPSQTLYYYSRDNDRHVDYRIYLKNGMVYHMTIDPFSGSGQTVLDFIQTYGKPDYVTWSNHAVHTGRVVIFANAGILLETRSSYASPSVAYLDGVEYFAPCNLNCVLEMYKYLIRDHPNSSEDPRPAQDPWGLTNTK